MFSRSHTRRRTLGLSALALLLAALLATGAAHAQDRTKISIAWGSGSEQLKEMVINGFRQQNPDLEVEFITGGWNAILNQIPVQYAAGVAPTVFFGESGRALEWGYAGMLADLAPMIERDLDESEYYLLRAAQDGQGHVWGIPGGFQVGVMFYNKNHFDEGAVAYPTADWTLSDFVNAGKRLTRYEGNQVTQYGAFIDAGFGTVGWLLWGHLLGGRFFDESGTRATFTEPATVAALETMNNLVHVERIAPTPDEWPNFQFAAGKSSMIFAIFANANTLQTAGVSFSWDVEQIPASDTGNRFTTAVPNTWMINSMATPDQREAAWRYIRYFLSPEVQEGIVAYGSEAPVTRAAGQAFLAKSNVPENRAAVLESLAYAGTLDENAAWFKWWFLVGETLMPAFRNEVSMQTALQETQVRVQAVLDEVYKK